MDNVEATMTDIESRQGRCYELAFERIQQGGLPDGAVLVHGYPTLQREGPDYGIRYGHAWVQWPTPMPPIPEELRKVWTPEVIAAMEQLVVWTCWDPIQQVETPLVMYYSAGRIDPELCSKYSAIDAMCELLDHETWGPWAEPPPDALFATDN